MNFKPIESFYDPKKFQIGYADLVYKTIGKVPCSFQILQPRLFGLTYPEYLRMLRDDYGAEMWGRNEKGPYVSFQFPDRAQCLRLCKELEARWLQLQANSSQEG